MVALSRAVARKQAMEMLLTGDMISAAEAQRIGLVNRVVAGGGAATPTTWRWPSGSPPSRRWWSRSARSAFYRQLELDAGQAYDYASHVMTENMLACDAEEGIDAFLQKRKPVWQDC